MTQATDTAAAPDDPAALAAQLTARFDALAQYSEDAAALTRTYLSAPHRAAGERLLAWMREAGMDAAFDAVGNAVGRYAGERPGLPALLIGSHYDTVRNAGRYDGTYGILAGIACVAALHRAGERLPFAIEVAGFADEEGVRFGATLLGSRAVAGTFDPALLTLRDAGGVSMADALRAAGLDPERIGTAARRPEQLLGYVEAHIEQGPVLLDAGLPLGVVTAIAGATRLAVEVAGRAGHAGTVPMALRRDAAAAAAEAVLCVERCCSGGDDLVGTVGRLEVPDGAVNVIPGLARFSVDVRAGDDARRRRAVAAIRAGLDAIAARRGVTVSVTTIHDAAATPCAPRLGARLAGAIERAGFAPRWLTSGAGHDAMAFHPLTEVAMLFVRCGNGGVSHHPDEALGGDDAALGVRVLLDFIRDLAAAQG